MMRRIQYQPTAVTQRGAVLVVSLILLLIMTILALAASQSTRMQERMAGNMRDSDLAFQSAEASLREAEMTISKWPSQPVACAAPPCNVFQLNVLPPNLGYQNQPWWHTNGRQYAQPTAGTVVANTIPKVSEDPRSVIEEIGVISDSLTRGYGVPATRTFYRNTAHGSGGTQTAEAVVESTFTRRY